MVSAYESPHRLAQILVTDESFIALITALPPAIKAESTILQDQTKPSRKLASSVVLQCRFICCVNVCIYTYVIRSIYIYILNFQDIKATESGPSSQPSFFLRLTCDAFGVLPPVSKLTPAQAMQLRLKTGKFP